jgi:hypothetical protein
LLISFAVPISGFTPGTPTNLIYTKQETATQTVTEIASSGGKSIQGGSIAGIVIGVLAAVAIAGLVLFILWRRKNRKASRTSDLAEESPGKPELPADTIYKDTPDADPAAPVKYAHVADAPPAELPAEDAEVVEIGPGPTPQAELDSEELIGKPQHTELKSESDDEK